MATENWICFSPRTVRVNPWAEVFYNGKSMGTTPLKHPVDGAREGAEFIKQHIIRVTERAFDDFAGTGTDDLANRKMLGLA